MYNKLDVENEIGMTIWSKHGCVDKKDVPDMPITDRSDADICRRFNAGKEHADTSTFASLTSTLYHKPLSDLPVEDL